MKKKVIYSLGLAMLVGGLTSDANGMRSRFRREIGIGLNEGLRGTSSNQNTKVELPTPMQVFGKSSLTLREMQDAMHPVKSTSTGGSGAPTSTGGSGAPTSASSTNLEDVRKQAEDAAYKEKMKQLELEMKQLELEMAKQEKQNAFFENIRKLKNSGDPAGWKMIAGQLFDGKYHAIVVDDDTMCSNGATATMTSIDAGANEAMGKFVAQAEKKAKGLVNVESIARLAAAKVQKVEAVLLKLKAEVSQAGALQDEIAKAIAAVMKGKAQGNGDVNQADVNAAVDDDALTAVKKKLSGEIGTALSTLSKGGLLNVDEAGLTALIANIEKYAETKANGNGPNINAGYLASEESKQINAKAGAQVDDVEVVKVSEAKAKVFVNVVFDFALGWCRSICCSDAIYEIFGKAMELGAFEGLDVAARRQVIGSLLQLGRSGTMFNGFDFRTGQLGGNAAYNNWDKFDLQVLTANVAANVDHGFLKLEGLGLNGVAGVENVVPSSMIQFLTEALRKSVLE